VGADRESNERRELTGWMSHGIEGGRGREGVLPSNAAGWAEGRRALAGRPAPAVNNPAGRPSSPRARHAAHPQQRRSRPSATHGSRDMRCKGYERAEQGVTGQKRVRERESDIQCPNELALVESREGGADGRAGF